MWLYSINRLILPAPWLRPAVRWLAAHGLSGDTVKWGIFCLVVALTVVLPLALPVVRRNWAVWLLWFWSGFLATLLNAMFLSWVMSWRFGF